MHTIVNKLRSRYLKLIDINLSTLLKKNKRKLFQKIVTLWETGRKVFFLNTLKLPYELPTSVEWAEY